MVTPSTLRVKLTFVFPAAADAVAGVDGMSVHTITLDQGISQATICDDIARSKDRFQFVPRSDTIPDYGPTIETRGPTWIRCW